MQNIIELSGDKNKFGNIVVKKFKIFEMKKMLDIFQIAGDEIIHSNNGKSFFDKPVAKVRSEKSGGTGDEYAFFCHNVFAESGSKVLKALFAGIDDVLDAKRPRRNDCRCVDFRLQMKCLNCC